MGMPATIIVLTYSGYRQRISYLKSCGFVYDEVTIPPTPRWVFRDVTGEVDSISDDAVMYYPSPKFGWDVRY